MTHMETYFTRQIALWGIEKQASLAEKKIAIIGSGGLGSTLALTLGSSGIGTIHLVDFGIVTVHNLHRQIAFTHEDEGKFKCTQLSKLLRKRCDSLTVYSYPEPFEAFTQRNVELDLIIDATDNFPSRAMIDQYAKSRSIPWLHGSVEGFHGYVCLLKEAPFNIFEITDRKPGGITPPIVAFIAAFQANFALRYLAGLPVVVDELNYLFFDVAGNLQHRKLTLI